MFLLQFYLAKEIQAIEVFSSITPIPPLAMEGLESLLHHLPAFLDVDAPL